MGMKHFTELDAWKNAHQLVLFTYQTTARFPNEERFGLTSQMRRAAVSITSNIAEGFGRHTEKDKIYFYAIAKSSLAELENQFLIALDLAYTNDVTMGQFRESRIKIDKLLSGLIKSAESKPLQP